jgi:putative oxidoreductase
VSTEDDRPRHAGGDYSNTSSGLFDDSGYSNAETTVLPSPTGYEQATYEETPQRTRPGWHAGADLGLLVLRLVVGVFFLAHAGQKLFGWFQGGGIDGTARFFETLGFTSNTTLLAWVAGVTELVGGALVLLGLFTPAGAGAILGLMIGAIWVKFRGSEFLGDVELEATYAAAAFALLFAGPGRVSLDRPTPWYRYPAAFGVVFLLLAAGGAVTFVLVFR